MLFSKRHDLSFLPFTFAVFYFQQRFMDESAIKRMLNQITALARTQQKLARLSGENFNVFRILGLHTKEVRTHSAFLGELLNPAGSHGMEDAFLRLFVDAIAVPFETSHAKLTVEKHIGQIDADYLQGGRIDLYLESHGACIFIENKIYAADQQNQLARYYEHNPGATLLYLTLEGAPPTTWSAGGLTPDQYRLLSYREHIAPWLQQCHQAAAAHPIVRETIVQYLHLVNHLTGKAPSNFMTEETKHLLLQDYAHFESAWHCKSIVEDIERETHHLLYAELEEAWGHRFPETICYLGLHPVKMYFDYDADGFYYAFRAEPLAESASAPAEVLSLLAKVGKEVNSQMKSSPHNSAWSYFRAIRRVKDLDRRDQFDLAH